MGNVIDAADKFRTPQIWLLQDRKDPSPEQFIVVTAYDEVEARSNAAGTEHSSKQRKNYWRDAEATTCEVATLEQLELLINPPL